MPALSVTFSIHANPLCNLLNPCRPSPRPSPSVPALLLLCPLCHSWRRRGRRRAYWGPLYAHPPSAPLLHVSSVRLRPQHHRARVEANKEELPNNVFLRGEQTELEPREASAGAAGSGERALPMGPLNCSFLVNRVGQPDILRLQVKALNLNGQFSSQ